MLNQNEFKLLSFGESYVLKLRTQRSEVWSADQTERQREVKFEENEKKNQKLELSRVSQNNRVTYTR